MKQKELTTRSLTDCRQPCSVEAEKAVIGALLLESTAIHDVSPILTPECFYDSKLATIYEAVTAMNERGTAVDMVSVAKELMSRGKLEEVGGPLMISQLTGSVVNSSHIIEHALYIHQLYLARQLVIAGQTITGKALDQTNDIGDLIADSLRQIESISEEACFNAQTVDLSHATRKAITLYTEREEMARSGKKAGISTGLERLDRITGGWKPGQLVILAARPAMGKTALLLHFARAAALLNVPVVVFSLEMSTEDLTDRLMLSESRLNADRYKNGYLSESEKPVLCAAADRLSSLPVTIDDTANLPMQQIKARAKNLQRKGKCGMVLIDYLQLIDMRSSNRNYTREQEVSQCSRSAKLMAKELGVPVILLSQLSRKNEERSDKMPILSDLRDSGAIEQDADIVLFIHRPEYYDEKNAEKGVGKLILAKHRSGASGVMRFRYNESLTQIKNYEDADNQHAPF